MRRLWTPLSAGVCASTFHSGRSNRHPCRGSREIDVFVASLKIYPIKSTAPLDVTSSMVGPRGLDNDRRWMVIDDANLLQALGHRNNVSGRSRTLVLLQLRLYRRQL